MKKGYWITVKDIIRKSDIVLEILDARFPELTRIRKMEEYAAFYKKEVILVVNKIDIVSETTLKKNKKQFPDSVLISTKLGKCIPRLVKKIKKKKL